MTTRTRTARVALALGVLASSCHHPAPSTVAAPTTTEKYCWWTTLQAAVPMDTVAERFRHAYSSLGLTVAPTARRGDTVWVAAISEIADRQDELRSARMVAYRVNDSTHFRSYVGVGGSGSQLIARCQQIARGAGVSAVAAREPGDEEQLTVWRQRP